MGLPKETCAIKNDLHLKAADIVKYLEFSLRTCIAYMYTFGYYRRAAAKRKHPLQPINVLSEKIEKIKGVYLLIACLCICCMNCNLLD